MKYIFNAILASAFVSVAMMTSAFAEKKVMSFSINNQSLEVLDIVIAPKKTNSDDAGCQLSPEGSVLECTTDQKGNVPEKITVNFNFNVSGNGPIMVFDQQGFTISANGNENPAKMTLTVEPNTSSWPDGGQQASTIILKK